MAASYYRYWGKAKSETEAAPAYHLLPYHCLDVAAVAICWWEHSKSLRLQLVQAMQNESEELAKAWVMFFVALHDLGKLDIRFQCKAWRAAIQLQPDIPQNVKQPNTDYYHGDAGYAWFLYELSNYGFSDTEVAAQWMAEVAGHHGVIPAARQDRQKVSGVSPLLIERDQQARINWVDDLSKLFQVDLTAIPEQVPLMLAGFCSVCDWIGSSEYFSYEAKPDIDLKTYLESRSQQAVQALTAFGIFAKLEANQSLETLFPGYTPQGLQILIDDLPLQQNLTLIEAPTGSGKTETALVYAAKMLHAGLADSIIFALPTQATANAMLDRLEDMASHLFAEGANVVLAHGKSSLHTALKTIDRTTAQGSEDASQQAARWLTASKKRAFLGQIGVCTIDQVLLSVLPVKHKFVRSFGVQKSLLIVDEVHAYDSYMYGLLAKVLEQQHQAGGSVLLLSATLPQNQRQYLANSWDKTAIENTDVYPLITQIYNRQTPGSFPITDSQQLPEHREVMLETWQLPKLQFDDASLQHIISAASQGAKVAVICNLVADAQGLAKRLSDVAINPDIPVDLFHSRFRFADRQVIEDAVKTRYGKDEKKRVLGGRILIATQVIEQSLDLDFDWMITQLCPVDLLFQRMGRLHRHLRPAGNRSPDFRVPRCVVIVPEQAQQYGHTGEYVYQNIRVLWRTEQLIGQHSSVVFPKAYRDWIGKVYQDDPWPEEPSIITEAFEHYHDTVQETAKMAAAWVMNLGVAEPFSDESDKASLLTRDGEMSLTVVPVLISDNQRFTLDREVMDKQSKLYWEQLSLNSISVPNSWISRLAECPKEDGVYFLALQEDGDHWRTVLGKQQIIYSKTIGLRVENN
ncbi:CRISPR-associated helicase/endonuclease Cas3 [Methylomonas montana]|uniref:CRISPR-associated helicase/endonuclease Cas3 n=1 Tax=Methylomonas montana TaxID=3058963 RepID=UPI00265AF6A1|nr:CRISPR-associated helicase/endonuclease Cas3 [Methylomonas montana]WKJ90929.1 CRISPR-associated helicase/endonuclease Cas3 [Methylomonas montana]